MSWQFEYTPYMWPMLASAAFLWALAVYAWRHRSAPGAVPLSAGMFVVGLWALLAALEASSADLPTELFWFRLKNVVNNPAPVFGFLFALEYSGLGGWVTRRNVAFLLVPTVASAPMMFLDDSRMLWTGYWVGESVQRSLAPMGVAINVYDVALLLLATAVIALLFVRSPLHRMPAALIILGNLGTAVVVPLEILNVIGDAPFDVGVLGLDFTFAMYAVALFRFRIFDVVPVARQTVLDRMADGMLVMDTRDRIADLNPAVQELLGVTRSWALGRPAGLVLGSFPGLLQLVHDASSGQTEIVVKSSEEPRWYQVNCSPLGDRRGFQIGRLVVFRDVTESKRAQELAIEQQRALAAIQERERVARELHDTIGQVLGYVSLQIEAMRKLLEDGNAALASAQMARLAEVARDAHADVRGYILDLRAAPTEQRSFVASLRHYLEGFTHNYGIQTSLELAPGLEEGLDPEAQGQLFRIVQEALSNARRHGGARNVRVALETDNGRARRLVVQDDGSGFEPETVPEREHGRFGLQFMRERAEGIGGLFEVHSTPGEGTRVVVEVPIRKSTQAAGLAGLR